MTKEILEYALRIHNEIYAIENVIKDIVSDDGRINRLGRIEVRVAGSERSVILDVYNTDKVLSILSKELDRLKEEFENIKI